MDECCDVRRALDAHFFRLQTKTIVSKVHGQVKKAIDEMKADLKKEQAAEVKKKVCCAELSSLSPCKHHEAAGTCMLLISVQCLGELQDWCTSEFQKKKLETQDLLVGLVLLDQLQGLAQEKTREEQSKLAEMESLQSSVSQLAGDIKHSAQKTREIFTHCCIASLQACC